MKMDGGVAAGTTGTGMHRGTGSMGDYTMQAPRPPALLRLATYCGRAQWQAAAPERCREVPGPWPSRAMAISMAFAVSISVWLPFLLPEHCLSMSADLSPSSFRPARIGIVSAMHAELSAVIERLPDERRSEQAA